ncbi:bacilysin exporter BacE [Bacillus inaquosorum]|uniref:Bacilysin exporter BacE n=1 Tax=Bacillus inaquosorum KCTC 13429 TaxID=1236548 RepID=A0A9W5LLR8_9BACI|nr:bacilysin exporter BacE [Bacillus inaquosorum]AWM18862.1 MFS transporter [Bacillus inaquosorum]ELS63074.1 putative bacilysin exporter BacE [Bacillus inaquosorum KCTC 13429]MCY8029176.1 bacilysin exporter BacE [Bacillus inaquosorum]MCY8137991.1 bacilysin exporter BacE [Bacillus inaquosorum]MCY8238769.1 bacilysin exporter BacE [Bacillus inaquosorum]
MKQLKPNSKYLLYGQALSFMGDYCVLPALLILSTYYHDYWVTSGVIVVRSIPMVFQPFLGVLVDRLDRVKIMLWTDIIRGLIFLGLTFLPKGEYPLIFLALLFISYGSGVFFNPARLAVMSSLESDIKNINTLFAKATTISIIVGAAAGGLFLLGGSVELAVAFNGVTYLISAIFISRIKLQFVPIQSENIKEAFQSFKEGLKEIKTNAFVLNAMFTMITMAMLWGIVYSYFPIVSRFLGDGEIGNFILTFCIGFGGFIGAALVSKWGFNNNRGLTYFTVLSIVSLALFLFTPIFAVSVIAAILFFIAMEYGEVLAKVKVQENAANQIQGRIFSVAEASIGLCISVGSMLINVLNAPVIMGLIVVMVSGLFLHTKLVNKSFLERDNKTEQKGVF